MIPQETIEQIRQATDIVQIISAYSRLKKRGRSYTGLCPFHSEKTPSFTVSAEKQVYHCFGCGAGGNVFTFLMEHEKMSFVEAARFLAHKANITIRETDSDYKRDETGKLNYAHEVALDYFRDTLQDKRYEKVLKGYLMDSRGISEESIEHFKLGLSGESWEGLLQYAKSKDLQPADLVKAGLAIYNEQRNSYFDRFRQRLMFPIFNLSRKPIAFGGRTLKKGEKAKYVNSPETPLYSKSNVLYGLNFARADLRDANFVYVVEGYFDVISLWQAGIKNVVASSGTAFTQQQARLLARFVDDVYLFFDADSAGQKAALKSVDSLYDAGLEVKIVIGPEGEDPDSIARKFGPDKIDELRHDAIGYIPYRVRNVELDQTGIIGKEKLIKEMKAIGMRIADPTRRSLFFAEAAETLSIDKQILQDARIEAQAPSGVDTGTRIPRKKVNQLEFEFLSVILNNPDSLQKVFEKIAPDDFESKELSRIYAAVITQYGVLGEVDANALVENLADSAAVSLLTEIAAKEWDPDKVNPEAVQMTKEMRNRKRKRIRARLQQQLKEAEAAGDQEKADALLEELKAHGL